FFYASSLPPVYQASATLLIESEDANIVSIQDVYSTGYRGYEYRQTQFELRRSQSLADRAPRRPSLRRAPRCPITAAAQAASPGRQPGSLDLGFLTPAGHAGDQGKARLSPEEREARHIAGLAAMIAGGIKVSPVSDSQIVTITYRSTDPEFA